MTFSWHPRPRPVWVTRFNDHADFSEGAPMVSLDPDELMTAARQATGLDDFGDADGWRDHFDAFMAAIDAEMQFTLLGATLTRNDILRALENRLQLIDLWTRHPEILESPVSEPLFIVGAARSGTSILHELLALDPTHEAPTAWKVHRPVAAATGTAEETESARRSTDSVVRFWHDIAPEYEAMHHNHGELPTECIFITVPMFLSDNWGGTHTAPSYQLHLATADHTPAYEWHKKVLQTLQLQAAGERWVLKAPSHLPTLRQLFTVYPDARIIHIHRDPAKTIGSMLDLMGTLKWMRTDHVDLEPFVAAISTGIAQLQRQAVIDRADGTLPDDRFHDLHYAALLTDPVAAIERAYRDFGWNLPASVATAITDYLSAKPKGAKGVHSYALEDFGLTATQVRDEHSAYIERFSIPEEI